MEIFLSLLICFKFLFFFLLIQLLNQKTEGRGHVLIHLSGQWTI